MNTWMIAVGGGVLIGLSATLLLWFNGRIAGISGILNGLTDARQGDRGWRLAFLFGLMVAGGLAMRLLPMPAPRQGFSITTLILAGILVGFGTRLGGGCTSGHGVCGLGRLSRRSLVAVLIFMSAAMLTVFLTRHVLGAL